MRRQPPTTCYVPNLALWDQGAPPVAAREARSVGDAVRYPSRLGRLPLRSRRPACAAQPAATGRERHHRRRDMNHRGSSLGLHRRTPGRRHQERSASLTRWPQATTLDTADPAHETACARERGGLGRPRSGRLQAVTGRAGPRIGENCWQAFGQLRRTFAGRAAGRDQPAARSPRSTKARTRSSAW